MATTAQDNLVKATGFDVRKVEYPVDTAGLSTFNQGDMTYFDTSTNLLKALDTDGHASAFAGVALKSSQLSLFVNQNTGSATTNVEPRGLVGVNGIFSFKTTAAETYKEGTVLYIGADAQTVTTVAGSNSVGIIKQRSGAANAAAVTGASGTSIDVMILVKYPIGIA